MQYALLKIRSSLVKMMPKIQSHFFYLNFNPLNCNELNSALTTIARATDLFWLHYMIVVKHLVPFFCHCSTDTTAFVRYEVLGNILTFFCTGNLAMSDLLCVQHIPVV